MSGFTRCTTIGVILCLLVPACAQHAERRQGDEVHIVRTEQADIDASLKRIERAGQVVTGYDIVDERLTVRVDGAAWKALGRSGQDSLKRALWRAWADAYTRRSGPTSDLIFVLVEDQLANNLGSYFARATTR